MYFLLRKQLADEKKTLAETLTSLQEEKAKTEAAVAEASLKITSLEEAAAKVEGLGVEIHKVQTEDLEVQVRVFRMA